MVTIKDYYDSLGEENKETLEKINSLDKRIKELEKNEIVKTYISVIKELNSVVQLERFEFLRKQKLSERLRTECAHPIIMLDYDLVSINHVVLFARCLVCNKPFYVLEELDLNELYKNKRLIAKECSQDYESCGYTMIDDYTFDDIKQKYYKLYIKNQDYKNVCVEDILFDTYSKGIPKVFQRKRKKDKKKK